MKDLQLEPRKIADSRGRPTVEVTLRVAGVETVGDVPAGASTGEDEANTVDVEQALKNVTEVIGPMLRESGLDLAKHSDLVAAEQAMIDRVIRSVRTHFERGGGGRMTVQLGPPSLGRMTLELRVRGGVLSATIQTTTEAARAALSGGLSQLRSTLAEQGIQVERFEVYVAADGRRLGGEGNADADGDGARRRRRGRAGALDTSGTAPAATVPMLSGDLDVMA